MWDPLRPLNKCEELFVSCLTDVSHRVIRAAAATPGSPRTLNALVTLLLHGKLCLQDPVHGHLLRGSPSPLPIPVLVLPSLALLLYRLPLHACGQALLIAAVLTAVPLALVHRAVLVVPARVGQVLTDGALEEAFAALTAVNPVVFA